jgi:TolB-like protein/Tfp pilus assembly protein PilF
MLIWSAEIKEIERLYDSIKGQSPELEKELERLISASDENMVLVYARRCLEVIITDLCESELKRPRKTEPLQGIIDKLNREEKIPSHIFASMQSLNSLSTFGSHPKEFDPRQVKPVLNNLTTIIEWYLKYKDTQTISVPKTEVAKDKTEGPDDSTGRIQKPEKRLILLVPGLTLVVAIVVATLFIFNIIGERKQAEDLTKLEKSIAVLPFENLSSDEEQAWFSDGITDVIINQLSKISDLRVLSRTSTLKYEEKEEKKSIPEIGEELGVNYIIEGTVQRQENKMRISVQLIRALNEGHIWAEVYDREWKDIFDVQSDIAQRIAEELKSVLTPEEKERFERTQTENPEAYNLYLQGRFFWNKRTEEGLKKSIEYFEKSVALDPEYALAYAGLADAYSVQAWWGWVTREKGNTKAKEMAVRALEIDNDLVEAHATLGSLLCYSEWKWEEARKELIHAIELDPNYLIAHSYYSELLDILGQNEEARKHINLALAIDPFFPLMHGLSSIYYYHEGKYKESLDECWKVEELAPDKMDNNWRMFFVYIKMGDDLNAIDVLQKIIQKDKLTAETAKNVKEVYNKSGIKGLLNWIIDLQLDDPYVFTLARSFVLLDKKNEALNVLENKLAENAPSIARINNDPDFDNLRSEPRFVAIIKKLGLSEYVKKE